MVHARSIFKLWLVCTMTVAIDYFPLVPLISVKYVITIVIQNYSYIASYIDALPLYTTIIKFAVF